MMMRRLRSLLGALALGLAVCLLACKDPGEGATGNTALYVFDASDTATGRVLAWDDLQAFYDKGGSDGPTRRIGGVLVDNVKNLGVGGMTFDASSSRLYLVSASGLVVRIERADKQNGTLSSTSDIVSFQLDAGSSKWTDGRFSQASVDRRTGTLYVTETSTGNSDTRIWVVSNPGSYGDGATVSLQALTVQDGGDTGGMGVTVSAGGNVYGFFKGGKSVYQGTTSYSGPRIRCGTSSSFPKDSQVLIGTSTRVGSDATGGSLAMDTDLNLLYVSRQSASAASTEPAILVFKAGTFSPGFNQGPDATLSTLADLPEIFFIAHGGSKDWLIGVTGQKLLDGAQTLQVWRGPSQGGSPKAIDLSAQVGSIRGVAIAGVS